MKTKLSVAIDFVFVILISFILSLIIFNYFTPHPFSVIYSALFCASTLLCSLYFYKRSHKNLLLKTKREKDFQVFVGHMNFCTTAEQNSIIENALCTTGYQTERKKGAIFVKDTNAVIFCKFGFDNITKTDVVKIFNRITKTQTAFVLAEKFEPEVERFAMRFEKRIVPVTARSLYDYLFKNHCLPTVKANPVQTEKQKINLKSLLQKKKAKHFLFLGVAFILTSRLVPIPIYYLVLGGIFLIVSLILRLFGQIPEQCSI